MKSINIINKNLSVNISNLLEAVVERDSFNIIGESTTLDAQYGSFSSTEKYCYIKAETGAIVISDGYASIKAKSGAFIVLKSEGDTIEAEPGAIIFDLPSKKLITDYPQDEFRVVNGEIEGEYEHD